MVIFHHGEGKMNKLQVLITDKLREGKSFRQIAEESGVNHVSISQYHKGIEPDGKNISNKQCKNLRWKCKRQSIKFSLTRNGE